MSSAESAKTSILMAAYRAEATILRAVRSVLGQTRAAWELIIASDDGTDYLSFCAARGVSDGRIRGTATDAPGSGPSIARNRALGVATGDCVAALDADDFWESERLAVLVPLAMRHGIAADNVRSVTPTGDLLGTAVSGTDGVGWMTASGLAALDHPIFPVVRREVFGTGYSERIRVAEDVLKNIECIARVGGAMPVVARSLTNYVQHRESLCNRLGSWRAFDAAYRVIRGEVSSGRIVCDRKERARLLGTIDAKIERNRRYGEAVIREPGLGFQEFAMRGNASASKD